MPTELTLADFAERVARREFCVWRDMRSILSDSTRKRAARIERATALLIDKHRTEYMRRYRIDEETFLSALRSVPPKSLPVILTYFDNPTEREKEIMRLASRGARDEAMQPLIARYRLQCAPARPIRTIYTSIRRQRTIFDRLIAKVLAAMVRPGVTVTATHNGITPRALRRVELQAAAIDIAQGVLTIAGHAWSMVEIEIQNVVTPTAPVAPPRRGGRKPSTRDNMVVWLSQHYPNGVPVHLKNAAILSDMRKNGILGGDKTLRRALSVFCPKAQKT